MNGLCLAAWCWGCFGEQKDFQAVLMLAGKQKLGERASRQSSPV